MDDFFEAPPELLFPAELDFVEPDLADVLADDLLDDDFSAEADLPEALPPPDFDALDLPADEPDLADDPAVDFPVEPDLAPDDFPAELDLLLDDDFPAELDFPVEPDFPAEPDFPVEPDFPAEADFPAVLDADLAKPLPGEPDALLAPPDFLLPDDAPILPASAFFIAVSAAPLTAPFAAPFPTSEIAFAACAATLPRVSPTVAAIPLSEPFLPAFDAAGFFVADCLAVDVFPAAFFSAIVSLLLTYFE